MTHPGFKTAPFGLLIKMLFFFLVLVSLALFSHAKDEAKKPPERGILHNNKGVTALYDGDTDKAIFEFKTATELAPLYVEAWNNLGLAYKYKGLLPEAEKALLRAIELDKKYAAPHNHLGAVYHDMGRHQEALSEYKLAIKYNPKFSDAYYNASLVYKSLYEKDKNKKWLDEAVTQLKSATDINAEHPHAHLELARIYQHLAQYEQAIIRYKLALEINPELCDAWANLASLYTQTGQAAKAQESMSKNKACQPGSSPSMVSAGLKALKEEDYDLAIQEFNKVISKDATNELAYFNIGFAYYKVAEIALGQNRSDVAQKALKQSSAAYESAFKIKPSYFEAAYNTGYNYQIIKDYSNAAAWYKKATQANNSFAMGYFSMGGMYQLLDDKKAALGAFCSYLRLKPQGQEKQVEIATSAAKTLGGCP